FFRKLDKLLNCVVLEKHGLQKPISFVRNSQNSKEEAHQLMVRLTRHTGRKNPPVSETVWRGLLQDLLDMQQNVYTCLEPETCHQVFVESLLCSGREENVRLAGQLMHCSAVSEDTPVSVSFRGKAHARVSYSRSVELVLAAAREYFNSSATLSDPCMNLARSCLLLITDCPSLVQEEMDLISALSRLEQFGVKVLPLQVRLRTDRLSLIKECISQCPTAYRQSTLLLSLARLLRVAGDDEAKRKGQVLTLLAEQALRCQDFKASYIHCQDLMAAGYSDGWDVCAQLGQCEAYSQLSARQKLMAFALTHCPPSSIQNLLATSSSLQTQVLYQAVNYKIDPSQARRTGSELSEVKNSTGAAVPGSINPTDLLHRTTARTLEVLTNTTMTTRAVLTAVSDSHWWRESLSLLRPLHGQAVERSHTGSANQNADLERQGCSPFYEELFNDPYVNTVNFTLSPSFWLSSVCVFLLQLYFFLFHVNTPLCLFLFQVLDANTCFEKQPPSALSLQLAAYYYSLQIYSRLAPCFKDKCSPLYRADPRELIRLVTKHVTDHAGCDWGDEELRVLIDQLRLYSERLTDFTQAQVLQGLGRGVDVQRFSSDNQYKKETILGLAETLDESVYGISRSLAQRYSIPLWEVHMTHLEFLFTDSGLSTKDIENRTEALGLFETLKTNPESFYTHMTKYVYPSIAGTDQLRLLFYFTLLENCGCASYFPQSAMNPDTHLKLLKKLKAVAVGLDYKKLTDEDSDPLKALEPVLTSQNVLSISKLAPRIPQKGGEALTSSAVHATWLHKLFWEGDQHVLKKAPQSDHDFLHAYDTCAKYFDRLLPVDSVNFMDAITFSPEAANKLSVESRLEITKRAQKALKGISDKSKKKGNDDRSENSASSFDSALTHIQQSLAHLETLSHSFPLSLKTSQELLQKYSRIYDLSRSEQSKVRHLAITMVMDGQPLERIEQLLAVSVGTSDLSVESVVQDAVERIITALSGDKDTLKDYADPLKVLEGIVAAVHTNVQSGGNMVTSEDMLAWLRPFCGDDSKAVRPRLEVLQILEHSFSLSDQDIHLLVFFRSQACEMKDVESEEQRNSLFLELLESSSKWEEFQHLMLLLQAWPPVTDKSRLETEQNPWVCLTSALLAYSSSLAQINIGNEVLTMCRSLYTTKHKLNPQVRVWVSSSLHTSSTDSMFNVKKIICEDAENAPNFVLDLCAFPVTEEVCDSELLSLLLNAGMLISCVDTALYSSLVSHMLAQGEWDVEKAAHDLHQAGHSAQAGSLLLSYRGSHPGQFTFNSALSVIRKWL
uniref:NBAS subunit of NRZ tethering complex n=1 Tax=Cyprinus carpio TaxID=7962 RepID=A0A8C1T569_CYPCA